MRSKWWPLVLVGLVVLTSGSLFEAQNAAKLAGDLGQPSVVDHRARPPAEVARSIYEQAMASLLLQKRFELSEILHYGVRSQPERYHLRLRFIASNRLSQERDDRPNVTIQVGSTTCSGPRRWHCRYMPFPDLFALVRRFVLPQPPLTHLAFTGTQTPGMTVITISATGDPWQCPPFAITCPIDPFDETSFQSRSKYAGILVVNRRTGLPQRLTSQVTMGFGPKKVSPALAHNFVSQAQQITFSYGSSFTINLPHYPRWKCPWWDPRGNWCMKEPGA